MRTGSSFAPDASRSLVSAIEISKTRAIHLRRFSKGAWSGQPKVLEFSGTKTGAEFTVAAQVGCA